MSSAGASPAMGIGSCPLLAALLVVAACANGASVQPASVALLAPVTIAPGTLSQSDVDRHAAALRAALLREVPQHIADTPDGNRAWISRAKAVTAAAAFVVDHAQLLVVIDRNPAVQERCASYWRSRTAPGT